MADEITYENGQPTYQGTKVVKCFKDQGNGLFFRIVNEDEQKWAFYNDTTNYNMKVVVVFGKDSDIEALGSTKMERNDDSGEYNCELTVAPLATEMFIEGEPNGFKISFEATPIPKA